MGLKRSATLLVAAGLALGGCAEAAKEGGAQGQLPITGVRPAATEGLNSSLHDAAYAAQRSGDYSSAVTFYNSLYDRNPNDARAALGLARNLRFIGATARAIEILQRAQSEMPDNSEVVGELGKTQLAAGRPEEALVTLMQARELMPADWRIHSALGIVFDRLGRYDSARESYDAALARSPDNASVLNNLALSYAQSGELEKGLNLLRRAILLPGATMQVRQNLALLYALSGDLDEAEKLARRDLPEEMVARNLEYYRLLAASQAAPAVARAAEKAAAAAAAAAVPRGAGVQTAPGTAPVQIDPWEEEVEAERVEAAKGETQQ